MSTQSVFDPDTYFSSGAPAPAGAQSSASFDPDTYFAHASTAAAPNSQAPPASPQAQELEGEEGFSNWFMHEAEGALVSPITGAAGLLARLTGHNPAAAHAAVDNALTQNLSPAGQQFSNTVERAMSPLGEAVDSADQWIGQHLGATAQDVTRQAVGTGMDVLGLVPAAGEVGAARTVARGLTDTAAGRSAEDILAAQAARSGQSMGAAAATPPLAAVSPQLKSAIQAAAQQTGGAVNPDALARHIEADTLPVPVQLTKGQALQDPTTLSIEQNARGRSTAFAQRFNEQNGQLTQNLQALRDEAGPDVFSTNPVEHGDTLIGAYQAKDAAAQAGIDAKYQALRDAAGGQFPVDAGQILSNSTQALHNQLLFEHAPPAVMSQLSGMAESGMTFEQFEALRTNLATIQRTSSDGLERRAAGVIRDQMEQLPLEGGAATLKPLADQARAAARQHFQDLEADPAYAAAVDGSVSPDKFVQRFVTGPSSTRDGVATMRANLADDPVASQTLGVAAIDHLRRSAGIDDLGNGNFSQANFNKQLQQLGPRLPSLVDPKIANQLSQVGEVARYTQAQPRGSFVNNSNTFTAAAGEHAKNALEAVVNAQAGGIPVATWVRKAAAMRQFGKMEAEHLKPGAGLTVLPGQ